MSCIIKRVIILLISVIEISRFFEGSHIVFLYFKNIDAFCIHSIRSKNILPKNCLVASKPLKALRATAQGDCWLCFSPPTVFLPLFPLLLLLLLLAIVLQLTPRAPLYFIVVNACKLRSQCRGRVSILTELIRVQSLFFVRHKKPSIRGQHHVLPRYEQYPVHTNGCARRRASRVFLWLVKSRLEIGPNRP